MNEHSSRPLYEQVKKTITGSILSGQLQPGDRLLTTKEMAAEFQVSHRTVQHAMSDLVTEGLVVRRPQRGSFVADRDRHGYAVPVAQRHVHVFLEVLEHEFISAFYVRDMLAGVRAAAAVVGCQVKLGLYSSLDGLRHDRSLAGVLLICPRKEEALAVKRMGVPAIQLDVHHPRIRLGMVGTHHTDGVMQGIRHLARLRHRNILYVHSDLTIPGNFSGRERFSGFQMAGRRLDIPLDGYTVYFGDLADRLRNPDFTAIMTDGYNTTVTTLGILREHGVAIPDDLSFVSFDDVDLADHMATPVTAVRQRLREVGSTAMTSLIENPNNWRNVKLLVRPELVVRSSTRPLPAS